MRLATLYAQRYRAKTGLNLLVGTLLGHARHYPLISLHYLSSSFATVERREASAPIARCAPRLTRAAQQHGTGACRRSATPRGWLMKEEGSDPGRNAQRAGRSGNEELRFDAGAGGGFCPGTREVAV